MPIQGDKFKAARAAIRCSQEKAAEGGQTTQTIISGLENLDKKQVSIRYLSFLVENGIDLNPLFDNNVDAERYTSMLQEVIVPNSYEKIKKLEEMIIQLQEKINTLLNQSKNF